MKMGLEQLLSPSKLGSLNLKNKIFMSSMNRCRADVKSKATPIMLTYYAQRSSAGIIFTEPLYTSQDGLTREYCSGLWSNDHIDGWRRIVDKVHENDGVIFATLSHGGRTSHPYINGSFTPISPSSVRPNIQIRINGKLEEGVTPREMDEGDINRVLDDFHNCAIRVKKCGFDGISLHATSGSLVECFIKSNTNLRTDNWGGEGGLQFPIQILNRFKSEFNKDLISIKINPFDHYNDMHETHPKDKYLKLIQMIHEQSQIGLIELKEVVETGNDNTSNQIKIISELFEKEIKRGSNFISNFGTKNINDAIVKMEKNSCQFVSCATFYVSNPDLPNLLKNNKPIILPDETLYYTLGVQGYIDY